MPVSCTAYVLPFADSRTFALPRFILKLLDRSVLVEPPGCRFTPLTTALPLASTTHTYTSWRAVSLSETTFGVAALRGLRGVLVAVGVAVGVGVAVLRATGGSLPLLPHLVPIRYSTPSRTTTPSTT